MSRYDVTDETVIDANPEAVYDAIVNEMDGTTTWGRPVRINRLREGTSFGEVGALVESTILSHSRFPVNPLRFIGPAAGTAEDILAGLRLCGRNWCARSRSLGESHL